MEPEKINNCINNFQNFIKHQNEIIESFSNGLNISKFSFELDEMFTFFHEHFEELNQKEYLKLVLSFLHRYLKAWITKGNYLKEDIGFFVVNFIARHRDDENDLYVVNSIVYKILYTVKLFGNNDVPITDNLLRTFISIVPFIESRILMSSCIACIQLYMEMFPESSKILAMLWIYLKEKLETNLKNNLTKEVDMDILIQLIDDLKSTQSNFYDEPVLINTIQLLLKSDQRKFRKCGFYLLKKFLQYFLENVETFVGTWLSVTHNQQIETSWIMYITILENLEEEQSHLILPSLENLEELVKSKQLPSYWLDILYMRMLTHNNNLVLRWSIEFILKTFSCSDLCAETLKYLLNASNSNLLYNYEGYFLELDHFSSFLKDNPKNLLTVFSEVENWKAVPLYIWLENLNKTQLSNSLTFEVILKISASVRKLQNRFLRKQAVNVCQELFKVFIEKMSTEEYVTYIETLYNSGDHYQEHQKLFAKKNSLIDLQPTSSIFKQRFYEIFINTKWDNSELCSFLGDLPVEQHGWLKFAAFQLELTENNKKIINNKYRLDLNSLEFCDLHKIINVFRTCLLDSSTTCDKHEQAECIRAAISFYVYHKPNFQGEVEDTLRFIVNTGFNQNEVPYIFATKLLNNAQNQINLWFIDELLKYNNKNIFKCVFSYLRKFHDMDIVKNYAIFILKISKFDSELKKTFSSVNLTKDLMEEWLKLSASKGEARIEEAFSFNHFDLKPYSLNSLCLHQIEKWTYKDGVLNLLNYHKDITEKKPRYFENSHEHRIKLRIAISIYKALNSPENKPDEDVLDQIWNMILNENNQMNIMYIYESILGKFEFREDVIINKLKEVHNLTSSQQVTIIYVTYMYFKRCEVDDQTKDTVIRILLSLTMGANFQTRLFAQMSLYQILTEEVLSMECSEQIIKSIECAAGNKLPEYLNDVRFIISDLSTEFDIIQTEFDIIQTILYITNAPFDENVENFQCESTTDPVTSKKIKECRKTFLNKSKVEKIENFMTTSTNNNQIQRKMNPINDLTEPHNLIIYPIEEKTAEMFVVASLIDKLPNLGGIARTCEVLGIQNLVMDSKKHTEKNDFKNLSMTAEKTLNIIEVKPQDLKEFLLNKKFDGYNIVGAEQTCNSESFINFQFPQKCVLLLGHEKDGIPAPLLGLLDFAVEIPQFGQVRSLNVHVTGALFMWEYCKQHLVQKNK